MDSETKDESGCSKGCCNILYCVQEDDIGKAITQVFVRSLTDGPEFATSIMVKRTADGVVENCGLHWKCS